MLGFFTQQGEVREITRKLEVLGVSQEIQYVPENQSISGKINVIENVVECLIIFSKMG